MAGESGSESDPRVPNLSKGEQTVQSHMHRLVPRDVAPTPALLLKTTRQAVEKVLAEGSPEEINDVLDDYAGLFYGRGVGRLIRPSREGKPFKVRMKDLKNKPEEKVQTFLVQLRKAFSEILEEPEMAELDALLDKYKDPETRFNVPDDDEPATGTLSFTADQEQALRDKDMFVITLEGKSLEEMRQNDKFEFSTPRYDRFAPDFETRPGRKIQVAINPARLFMPDGDKKTPEEQRKMIEQANKDNEDNKVHVPGTEIETLSLAEWLEVTEKYHAATGRFLFADSNSFSATNIVSSEGKQISFKGNLLPSSRQGEPARLHISLNEWRHGSPGVNLPIVIAPQKPS